MNTELKKLLDKVEFDVDKNLNNELTTKIKEFIINGANPNVKGNNKMSTLWIYIRNNDIESINLILNKGYDFSLDHSYMLLDYLQCNNYNVIKILINHDIKNLPLFSYYCYLKRSYSHLNLNLPHLNDLKKILILLEKMNLS